MRRDYQQLFRSIYEQWFLSEPLLFSVVCTHELRCNSEMLCPMRTGEGRIEYRPTSLDNLEEADIREMLRTEVIRIMLMHPYQRLPLHPDRLAMLIASDITITEHGGNVSYGMYTRQNWVRSDGVPALPARGYFEEYYALVREEMMSQAPDYMVTGELDLESSGEHLTPSGSKLGGDDEPQGLPGSLPFPRRDDAADLWAPDTLTSDRVHRAIENALSVRNCGTIPNSLIEEILADRTIRINARNHLARFRASVVSSGQVLSRMRPNRRYGFEQMGVRHPYRTRVLVGIDTSESISSSELSDFLGTINRFFSQGIEQLDVLFFDSSLHLPPVSMRRVRSSLNVIGRGGTDFQPIIDYYEGSDYDGLIVFTDGEAPAPVIHGTKKILWILTDRAAFETSQLSPKIYIPR